MDFVSWHCLSTQHFYEVKYLPCVLILLYESLSYSQAKKELFLKESYFESLKAFKQWNGSTYWEEVWKIIFSDLFRHDKSTGMCYKVRRPFEIDHSHWSLVTWYIYIYIQVVTGGRDQTSGGCSLCETIPKKPKTPISKVERFGR